MSFLKKIFAWTKDANTSPLKMQWNDLQRTSQLVLKTYLQAIEKQEGTIYAEGAYALKVENRSTTAVLTLTMEGGDTFTLGIWRDGQGDSRASSVELPGDVMITRADIIKFSYPSTDDNSFVVFRHKVVFKEDTIIYPPEQPDLKTRQ